MCLLYRSAEYYSTTPKPDWYDNYRDISFSKGYCMISLFKTMEAYSLDDGLTEEARVTKLRTHRCHHLFLHASLRHNYQVLFNYLQFYILCNFR